MGFYKSLDYVNPIHLWNSLNKHIYPPKETKPTVVVSPQHNMNLGRITGSLFVRIAGISGATAVAMGAYGSHGFYPKQDVPQELKEVYKTANYYHFIHSLALMAIPLTRRPLLVGSLMTAGMLIFCGTCYAYALTGNKSIIQFTPYGGTLLIISWLAMVV